MIHQFRRSYWSSSKLAKLIRKLVGVTRPLSAEMHEWNTWTRDYKTNHKIAYWFTDVFLKKLQNFLYYPWDVTEHFQHYFRNRFIDKPHCLNTKLTPGRYHEIDNIVQEQFLGGISDKSLSIIVNTHYARLSKLSLVNRQV